jgi:hypothetical protein
MPRLNTRIGLILALTAVVLVGLVCHKNPAKSKTGQGSPSDTIPRILGAYSGTATTESYTQNTHKVYSVNLEVDTLSEPFQGCSATYRISIGPTGSGTRQQYGTTGAPGQLSWQCSVSYARWNVVAMGDGTNFAGVIDQWTIHDGIETHLFSTSFSVSRPPLPPVDSSSAVTVDPVGASDN